MLLYNRLIRVDIFLVIDVILLMAVKGNDFLNGTFAGAGLVLFVYSIINHIQHYRQTNKFY